MQFSSLFSAALFVISPIYAGSNPSSIAATEVKTVVDVLEGSASQNAHAAGLPLPAPAAVAPTAETVRVPFHKRPFLGLFSGKNTAGAKALVEDHVASPEEVAALEKAVAERKIRNGKIFAGVSGAAVGGIAGGLAGNAWARSHNADKINIVEPNAATA